MAPVSGPLVTVCPQRFFEAGEVYRWIGDTILGSPEFSVATEVDFLQARRRSQKARANLSVELILSSCGPKRTL